MKWPILALSIFCRTTSGGTPLTSKKSVYYGGGIPWVKSGELRDDIINTTEESLTDLGLNESSANWVPEGAILIAMYGATVGRTAMLGIDAATNQAVCSIIPDPQLAYNRFVWYALRANVSQLLKRRLGGAQPNISQKIIRDIQIPLPPLSEQKQIVEILDQANALRKKRAEADAKTTRIIPALFYKMFGDPSTNPKGWRLGKFAELFRQQRNIINESDGEGIPYIGLEHVESNTGRILISQKEATNIKVKGISFAFSSDHVLYGKLRPYLNKVALPDFKGRSSTELIPLIPNDDYPREFIASYLRLPFVVNTVMSSNTGSRMPRTDMNLLIDMTIPLPPLSLQKTYADLYRSVHSQDTLIKNSSENLCILFKILLHRAFSGNLTAKWRKSHMKELMAEMDQQANLLEVGIEQ